MYTKCFITKKGKLSSSLCRWCHLAPKYSKRKLDMGKSCIRFKKPEQIPFDLIAGLVKKITQADWIKIYEAKVKR